jgi:hypothetical protein
MPIDLCRIAGWDPLVNRGDLRRSIQPRVIVVAQDPREAAVFARNQLASADRLVDIAAAETRPTADSRDIVGV